MTQDARFEDGIEKPLYLKAFTAEDLEVISALVQDAVFAVREMTWDKPRRRFAILLNRYRWERTGQGAPERVQSVLAFEDVSNAASQGFERAETELVLSLLSVHVTPGADGAARVELILAGDGGVALQVEALEATLRDVTRPYLARSRHRPDHG